MGNQWIFWTAFGVMLVFTSAEALTVQEVIPCLPDGNAVKSKLQTLVEECPPAAEERQDDRTLMDLLAECKFDDVVAATSAGLSDDKCILGKAGYLGPDGFHNAAFLADMAKHTGYVAAKEKECVDAAMAEIATAHEGCMYSVDEVSKIEDAGGLMATYNCVLEQLNAAFCPIT